MKDGAIQPSRLDEVCEIAHRDDESERLVAARARKRAALLASTERELEKARASVEAGRLRDSGKIGLRAARVLNCHKMARHFELQLELELELGEASPSRAKKRQSRPKPYSTGSA